MDEIVGGVGRDSRKKKMGDSFLIHQQVAMENVYGIHVVYTRYFYVICKTHNKGQVQCRQMALAVRQMAKRAEPAISDGWILSLVSITTREHMSSYPSEMSRNGKFPSC